MDTPRTLEKFTSPEMNKSNVYLDILMGDNKEVAVSIRCEKCGNDDCKVREQQVRASDEPLAIFITCNNCGHVSVDNL